MEGVTGVVGVEGDSSATNSMYDAGTRPLPPDASPTLIHPDPSSSSKIWTVSPSRDELSSCLKKPPYHDVTHL